MTWQIEVERIIRHENYRSGAPFYNDIALIRLARPAQLNNTTQLVCLPVDTVQAVRQIDGLTSFDRLSDVTAQVLGWGRTDYRSSGDLFVSILTSGGL